MIYVFYSIFALASLSSFIYWLILMKRKNKTELVIQTQKLSLFLAILTLIMLCVTMLVYNITTSHKSLDNSIEVESYKILSVNVNYRLFSGDSVKVTVNDNNNPKDLIITKFRFTNSGENERIAKLHYYKNTGNTGFFNTEKDTYVMYITEENYINLKKRAYSKITFLN